MQDYQDDEISLPPDTLEILNQFLAEKAAKEKLQDELIEKKDQNVDIDENWQLSQFWYNHKTKEDLRNIIQRQVKDSNDKIALLSCPSLYKSVKSVHEKTFIFEFDQRFSVYGEDFIHYDINESENESYLSEFQNYFNVIVADPPFLSEECIEKISNIIKNIRKENCKILFCSGEIVEPWLKKFLNLNKQSYKPEHENNLGNEFITYANFCID